MNTTPEPGVAYHPGFLTGRGLAVDIARENITPEARAAINAWEDAKAEAVAIERSLAAATLKVIEARNVMHTAVMAIPAGCDNATVGKRFHDYIDVVREERRA